MAKDECLSKPSSRGRSCAHYSNNIDTAENVRHIDHVGDDMVGISDVLTHFC